VSWVPLATHGDTEEQIREALEAEFDQRWTAIAQKARRQMLDLGMPLPMVFEVLEWLRAALRAETSDLAPQTVLNMRGTSARH
jgi:hypothetical protein